MRWIKQEDNKAPAPARHDALAEVKAYWQAARANRLLPDRTDIDPRGLLAALPHMFILEQVAPAMAQFRIAGTQITQLMPNDLGRRPISDLLTPASRQRFADVLQAVMRQPATTHLTLSSARGRHKPPLGAEVILLPLRSASGGICDVLGCLVTLGRIGRLPRRFDVNGSILRQIHSGSLTRLSDPSGRKTLQPGLAAPVTPMILRQDQQPRAMLQPTKARHLFVVRNS